MDIEANWTEFQSVFESAMASTRHCSIASISEDGTPHITPIGFIFLIRQDLAIYFEKHTQRLPANIQRNNSLCIMAIDTGASFWFKALLKGRFTRSPGIRIYGNAGARRKATADELALYERRVRPTRWLKGNKLIWTGLEDIREVHLHSFEPIVYPSMTQGLWSDA